MVGKAVVGKAVVGKAAVCKCVVCTAAVLGVLPPVAVGVVATSAGQPSDAADSQAELPIASVSLLALPTVPGPDAVPGPALSGMLEPRGASGAVPVAVPRMLPSGMLMTPVSVGDDPDGDVLSPPVLLLPRGPLELPVGAAMLWAVVERPPWDSVESEQSHLPCAATR